MIPMARLRPVRTPIRKLSEHVRRETQAYLATLPPERRAALEAEWK